MCRAYGDVVAAALASQMEATTVRVPGDCGSPLEEENGYIFFNGKEHSFEVSILHLNSGVGKMMDYVLIVIAECQPGT